jgi:hypothetical protein
LRCGRWGADHGELFRVDAKAEGGDVTWIAGWATAPAAASGAPPAPAASDTAFSAAAADIAIAAREIIRWRQTLNQVIAEHTGKTVAQIAKDSDRDYFLSAQEAKDYGLVDHVVSSTTAAQSLAGSAAA